MINIVTLDSRGDKYDIFTFCENVIKRNVKVERRAREKRQVTIFRYRCVNLNFALNV